MNALLSIIKEKKTAFFIQMACWLSLITLAIFYYKERGCLGDAGYITVELLTDEKAVIYHNRYTLYLAYFMPLFLIKLGASLKAIIISYGLNQFVVTGSAAIICILITKNVNDGWYFLIAQVLFVNDLFYYLVLEPLIYQATVLFFVAGHYYLKNEKFKSFYYLNAVIVLLCLVSSPNNIMLFCALTGILFLLHKDLIWSVGVKSILLLIGGVLMVKLILPFNGYEQNKFSIFTGNLEKWKLLDQAAIAYYVRSVFTGLVYKLIVLFIALVLIVRRNWVLLAGSILLLLLLHYTICVYLYSWEATAYMELYYQIVGIPISCLLCYCLLSLSQSKYLSILFMLLFIFGVSHILRVGPGYTRGIEAREKVMHEMDKRDMDKGWIKSGSKHLEGFITEWAVAQECVLISTLNNKTKTLYVVNDVPQDTCSACFLTPFKRFETHEAYLNKKYFNLRNQRYQLIYPNE